MKSGPVKDAQQTKQSVCTLSHLTVADFISAKQALRIKDNKCNLTQGLPENSKLPQFA
jgi:hypothetical protein